MAYDKLGYTIKATELKKWIDNTATDSDRIAWQLALSEIYGKSDVTSLADSAGNIDIGELIGISKSAGEGSDLYIPFLTDLYRQANGTSLYSFSSDANYTTAISGQDFYVKTLGNTALKLAFPYHLVNNNKIFGISKGGEFEGEGRLLATLDSPETDVISTNNLVDYTKYKIVRNPNGIYIYRYRVTRQESGLPDWKYNKYYADYSSANHPFKLVDGPWDSNGSLVSRYLKDHFTNGVVPMQFILAVSGAGGSGGYKTTDTDDSASAGGGGGAFALVYLDWSKVRVDDNQNRSIWIRIPHRSYPTNSNSSYQNYYNLSTALSSVGELYVDPLLAPSTDPIKCDCYSSTRCIQVSSGINAGYDNKIGKSALILDATNPDSISIAESPSIAGSAEKAFTVIAHAYGGEGASKYPPSAEEDYTNAKSAYSLLYGVQDTACTSIYLQTRTTNSASSKTALLASAQSALNFKGAGGSSWFSNGRAVNTSASLNAFGSGGGGRNSSEGPGFSGGSGCVKIYY